MRTGLAAGSTPNRRPPAALPERGWTVANGATIPSGPIRQPGSFMKVRGEVVQMRALVGSFMNDPG